MDQLEMLKIARGLKTVEEYRAFMAEKGLQLSTEDAEKKFAALQSRLTSEGKELDEDELDSINGGKGLPHCENTANGECHATVEDGSSCWGSDACFALFWCYDLQNYGF